MGGRNGGIIIGRVLLDEGWKKREMRIYRKEENKKFRKVSYHTKRHAIVLGL